MNKLPRKYIKNYSSDKYFCNRLYIFRFSFFHSKTFTISEFLSKRCWSRKSCFSWENRRKWLKDGIGRGQQFHWKSLSVTHHRGDLWYEYGQPVRSNNLLPRGSMHAEKQSRVQSSADRGPGLYRGAWYADASAVYYPRRESWAFVPFAHTVRGSSRLLTLNTGSVSGSGCAGCNCRRVLLCEEKGYIGNIIYD